jgi:soluble lytic murein transglycosylase
MHASAGRVAATLGSLLAVFATGAPWRPSRAEARPPGGAAGAAAAFERGVRAYQAGDYHAAEKALRGVQAKNQDWVLYLHGESAFYAGATAAARDDFEKLSRLKDSRFAVPAAFRVADVLWSTGAHAAAAERYRKALGVLKAHASKNVDPAVARFRVAVDAEERKRPEAAKLFLALYRELPAHPLATEAGRRANAGAAPGGPGTPASAGGAPADILRRAETLTKDRHWQEALDELAKLPADLAGELAVERDYQLGMTKFQMRRDYAKAGELLLKVAPSLTGDKAASALFHGTRALSRVDRDDEAIAGYKQVVARFPQSRFAAEAQFLAGFLHYNRGHFRESLPDLQATLDRFGKSAFADDAAWCVAFAHFLLGQLPEASAGLDRYGRMPLTGITADERAARIAYWRARIDAKAKRADAARTGYREVSRRWPFSFFGAAARARLAELGETVAIELPRQEAAGAPAAGADKDKRVAADPAVARADELGTVGLDVEAGWELQDDEKGVLRRLGDATGMRVLLGRYPTYKAYRRLYELGEARNGGALALAPTGDARLWWEAAYPRAYHELVDRFGPPAGNPELFLYAIMRKESGFFPWDVSYADARGLLQMIPPTSAKVAAALNLEFAPDELFQPETNIRLGATFIGSLAKKFAGQIPLVAGAFNAGPKAMAKWCDQHGAHPVDEFVELITFTQTREYAKRVVGIYARYRFLYGTSPYQLPLAVDAKYATAGPEF